ncbi:MAG TPA: hypothetical protein VJV79_15420 [Polyangiaceae bacterium]|nr:hypothetical protein [Polyangiaceae bacterium]
MSMLRFDITLADGSKESLQTDAERVLIGRGAHCDIRLPDGTAAVEHVAIEVAAAALRVRARAFTPPPTLNGEEFQDATISGDLELEIGAVVIRLSRVQVSGQKLATKKEGGSVAVRVIGVLALLALAGMLLFRASRVSETAPTAVPELWSEAPVTCPMSTSGQARAFAVEKRIVADGKRERHPFHASDGVEAVSLYQTAAACFEKAGDRPNADELEGLAQQLRADVNDDFRVRRLRLERALETHEDEVAVREVVMLRTLTLGKQGPYIDWINRLARKLAVDKDSP